MAGFRARWEHHKVAALRVLTGVGRDVERDVVERVADILGIGNPRDIQTRDVVRRVLGEHPDLAEVEHHLNEFYNTD